MNSPTPISVPSLNLYTNSFFLHEFRHLDVAGLKNSKLYIYNGVVLFFGWLVRSIKLHSILVSGLKRRCCACKWLHLYISNWLNWSLLNWYQQVVTVLKFIPNRKYVIPTRGIMFLLNFFLDDNFITSICYDYVEFLCLSYQNLTLNS